ncbi:MAG: hypothetical protein NZ570_03680 [Candidatus Caldarchaeum sp.]|nr:hypothetical protein [Candidatus Caldarchaeum sp.]MDW8359093.1 hypothetical protein [Candidatus Caldarchaeum sp.]
MMAKALRIAALSPPVAISLMALAEFDFSNYYVVVGMVSLLLISSTERVKWAAVGLVYIPAIYTVGLLLTGQAAPFLGLAAGYILASPLVLTISTYSSRSASGLLSGYFTAYTTSLLIYGVEGKSAQPETLFIHLVRNITSFITQERVNFVPPETPPTNLIASLTALATLALIITMASRRPGLSLKIKPVFLNALIMSVASLTVSTLVAFFLPSMVSLAILTTIVVLAFLTAVSLRGKDA